MLKVLRSPVWSQQTLMVDQKLELCDVYSLTILTHVNPSFEFMVGWMWTCIQVDTHMHRIVSNWINAQTKALQMQVIAYSFFHKECAQWIKHLWIKTHIDLNVTLWIHCRLLLRFRILTFPLHIIPQSLTLAYFFISLFPFHLFAIWEKWMHWLLPSCIQPEDINWPNANKWDPLILNVSH